MSDGDVIVVVPGPCPHCGSDWAEVVRILGRIERNQEITLSALTDLQAADEALKAEVVAFLADIATALSADDPAIEQVVADINAQVAALQAGDPVPVAPAEPPAG